MMIDLKKTGKKIRARIKEKGLDAHKIADQLCVKPITVYKWMEGFNIPNIDSLLSLAHLLDCKIDDLLEGRDDEE